MIYMTMCLCLKNIAVLTICLFLKDIVASNDVHDNVSMSERYNHVSLSLNFFVNVALCA